MLLLFVILVLVVAVLLLTTPTPPNANGPAGLDEFNFPTADSARSIPELYGTLWLFGNLIWYGGLSSLSMKSCQKSGGLF